MSYFGSTGKRSLCQKSFPRRQKYPGAVGKKGAKGEIGQYENIKERYKEEQKGSTTRGSVNTKSRK